MNSIAVSLANLACCISGAYLGMYIRTKLPGHHLNVDTKEMVKLSAGLIATMTALILGLLVSSSKDTFDTMNRELIRNGVKIIQLDRILAHYGSDAAEIRTNLKDNVRHILHRYWNEDIAQDATLNNAEKAHNMETLQEDLRTLSPPNDDQRQLIADAQRISNEIVQSRWLMIEMAQRELPRAFLVIVTFWLTVLFVFIGLITPHNGTVMVVFFICTLSVTAAIFLILEMNTPLSGALKISSAPLQKALIVLGK